MDKKMICDIIGSGKVGLALAEKLLQKNSLARIFARSDEAYIKAIESIPAEKIVRTFNELTPSADFYIFAVSDNAITKSINDFCNADLNISGATVCHTSGIQTAEILSPAIDKGANISAIHPYQTFSGNSSNCLKDITWGIDAQESEQFKISQLIELLEGKAVFLTKEQVKKKALYHASAVVASNFLTILIQLSKDICNEIGISAKDFLPPIIKQTIANNIAALDTDSIPLTGPIARGDVESIRAHLEAFSDNDILKQEYAAIGLAASMICKNNNIIDEDTYQKFYELFQRGLEK